MSCTRLRFLRLRSEVKIVFQQYSETTEANLTKLHRKIEHNVKVCRVQELGSYAQVEGHNHVRGQIMPEILLLIN